ncbi:MAG: hypothetical protein JJV97_02545 [SAR324 cluster bacterium]|nr:hypothetical protein [SAR324 cluster bacterium]
MKNKLIQNWQNLTFREKIMFLIFTLVILPVLAIKFGLFTIMDMSDNAYLDYQNTRHTLVKVESDLNLYNDLKTKNNRSAFYFKETLNELLESAGITEQPTINQNKNKDFGSNYILRFKSLRSDQIFQFIYYLEHNQPPLVIEKIETARSIQEKELAGLTVVVRAE